MAAQAQVEARSLSAINHLAAHPPQYPINPIGSHETLCLYISRVPGSRDIILSPFKPQRKNVTGDDVANSLYYVHLDTAGDELLAPKAQRQEGTPRGSMDSTRTQDTHRIARKPLPASAQVSQAQDQTPVDMNNPEEHAKFPGLSQPPSYNKENIPIAADAGSSNPLIQPSEMPVPPPPVKVPQPSAPIPRKPLGPRQMAMGPPSPSNELPHPPPEVLRSATPPTPEEQRPALPPRPTLPPLRFDATRPAQSFDEMRATRSPMTPSRSPSPWSRQKPFTPFSLTIIRRDPGTGHQWNIGKVSSFQSTILYQDPHSPDAEPVVQYPRGYPAINVHIETSGYARFRDFPTVLSARPGSAGGEGGLAQNLKDLAAAMKGQADAAAGQGADDDEGGFRRQVVMTYGKTWTHNLKEAFKSRNRSSTASSSKTTDDADAILGPPRAAGLHRRQDSGTSTTSNDSSFFPEHATTQHPAVHNPHETQQAEGMAEQQTSADQPVLTAPGPGLRPKGYTFLSPWDGRCDFRTSSSGRALKCRHTRNTTSQGFNPLVAAQALRDAAVDVSAGRRNRRAGGGGGGGRSRGMSASLATGDVGRTAAVSELRFNLPATDLFHNKEDRERAAREVVEGFARMLVRSPGGHEREGRYVDGGYEDDEDEEPIFDFSGLGREKAGGGNRGKRAKLGKLLVHDEGLKMLDLVIAANMGIWWQAWERSF